MIDWRITERHLDLQLRRVCLFYCPLDIVFEVICDRGMVWTARGCIGSADLLVNAGFY